MSGLVHRLERAGHVKRKPHPRDRRSDLLCLTPTTHKSLAETLAPLVAEIDAQLAALPEPEADVVDRFLQAVAGAAERHVSRLAAEADNARHDALAVPLPALWA